MIRLRGGLLVVCGALLGGFGAWLLYLTMGWTYPSFVPMDLVPTVHAPEGTPQQRLLGAAGLAALALLAFGAVAGLLGLGMLFLGRRNGVLFNVLMALFVILVVAGAAIALAGRS